jgi:hypothetical protein
MARRLLVRVRELDQPAFGPRLAQQLHAQRELLADETHRYDNHRPLGRAAEQRQRTLRCLPTITIEHRRKSPDRKYECLDARLLHRRTEGVSKPLFVRAPL